jgi:CheY-like chemotaxis protein
MADPDQIHQVLMNLVVNARDAMLDGGKLDIGTTNIDLDAASAVALHPDAAPGRYVLMTVVDTGLGMDEATSQQIFEPFFTTKDVGKGTGLGLSTVYGIVRQSGGWVNVWSQVDVGTSFNVYLPRIDGHPLPGQIAASRPAQGGAETILLVEDQDAVRSYTKAALREYGYQIIDAASAESALVVAKEHSGHIHLLLTDVVLPGMNGKELSERLKASHPWVKVLFASGYTADVIARHGVLHEGTAYIPKPYSPASLAIKVREVLEGPLNPIPEA